VIAAWVPTLQEDKVFVRLDEKTLRHFDVLDTSKMREAPDGEAAHELYGTMRRPMDVLPWGVVLTEVVRRDQDTGEARHVRVTVDATKEFGLCLRNACVDVDWAPDPNTPAHVAPTSGCGVAVDRPIQKGLMPLVEILVVTTVRVRRVAIPRGRRFAIARGRYRRHVQLRPLGRRTPLPPQRLHCLGRRACAISAFARPEKLLCQR